MMSKETNYSLIQKLQKGIDAYGELPLVVFDKNGNKFDGEIMVEYEMPLKRVSMMLYDEPARD